MLGTFSLVSNLFMPLPCGSIASCYHSVGFVLCALHIMSLVIKKSPLEAVIVIVIQGKVVQFTVVLNQVILCSRYFFYFFYCKYLLFNPGVFINIFRNFTCTSIV